MLDIEEVAMLTTHIKGSSKRAIYVATCNIVAGNIANGTNQIIQYKQFNIEIDQ